MKRITIESLVRDGLKYCCEYAFFVAHKKVATGTIATRLGVHKRTVREHRERFNEGELQCTNCGECLKKVSKALNARIIKR